MINVGDSIAPGASDIPPEVLEVKSRPNAVTGWVREAADEWYRDGDVWPTATVLAHAPLYVSKVREPEPELYGAAVAISQGRINNALRALTVWYRNALATEPSSNDMTVFLAHARAVLAADDKYLVGQTASANPDVLRLHLAKERLRVDEMKVRVREAQSAKQAANRREEAAARAIAEAKLLAEQAKAWQRAAGEYVRQANILRQQLEANGIEPDRRAS